MLVRDNEQLKAEVKDLLNSSALGSSSRDQGKTHLLLKLFAYGFLLSSKFFVLNFAVGLFSFKFLAKECTRFSKLEWLICFILLILIAMKPRKL